MCKHKRFVSILLVCGILFGLCGCGSNVTDIMDNGANRFAAGKEEDNYYIKNSGALLDSLIEKFSGSYQLPSSSKMDDDSFEDARKKADEDKKDPDDPADGETVPGTQTTPEGETVPVEEESLPEVGDWDDFLRVFHNAYLDTADYLEFRLVNGYTLDLSVDLQECFTELQREDPIYVSCVKMWSWGCQGDEYLIQIAYTMDPDRLVEIKDATEDLVELAAARIDTAGKSDYEIVCAVNDYLCDMVYYPATEPYAAVTHTAYGALADGVAVCEGYACAAKLLLNELGILCDIQVGTCTNGGGHAWNLVQLEGQWYQMDVTWNDGSADRTDYLLVTDAYMQKSRTWDFGDYPACAPDPYTP